MSEVTKESIEDLNAKWEAFSRSRLKNKEQFSLNRSAHIHHGHAVG